VFAKSIALSSSYYGEEEGSVMKLWVIKPRFSKDNYVLEKIILK